MRDVVIRQNNAGDCCAIGSAHATDGKETAEHGFAGMHEPSGGHQRKKDPAQNPVDNEPSREKHPG